MLLRSTIASGARPRSRIIGVSVTPGAPQLTRIPSGARSPAADLVSPRSAHLLAAYALPPAKPPRPEIDEMFTIEPPPARSIDGAACFMPRNAPTRLTSSTRLKLSSVSSAISAGLPVPALLTSVVTGPKRASAASIAATH